MPILVTQVFLGNLRDVPLLKICRLVCKSWNIEGSNSLRACSKVSIAEGSSRLKNFAKFVLQNELGPLQHLPSPFENFHAEGSTFTDPIFIELVLKIPITSLKFVLDRVNGSKLGSILESNKASLTELEIRTQESNHFELEKYKINEPVELTCLKGLRFHDLCSLCAHIQFLEGILNRCTPECLDLWLYNTDALAYLLTQDKADNLKKLVLTVSGISREAWKHLGNLRFLRLSSLFFCSDDSVDDPEDLQHWHLFCQNVSPLLEEFVTNLSNFFPPNLIFPNLKSIRIVDFIAWSYFTPDRFPSLVEIIFDFVGQLNIKAQNEVPHRGLPIERIPRRKSITDFVELETIKFGREFVMDPLMLRYCLPRVPKLRQIYLYWNGSLSTPLLWDSLHHLESIVIVFNADDKQVAMALAETFPNGFIG
ncbi:unnamed protein product [Allacma fusca]|uniref:F-box domain-containing protein n=1 Tax=Allacma fusca TaxID=39272 RepID=A0A8J2LHR9_9HEXA|nr:unnamed protein product [Allacma fusca]